MLRFVCRDESSFLSRYPEHTRAHHGETVYDVLQHTALPFLAYASFEPVRTDFNTHILYREDILDSKEFIVNDGPELIVGAYDPFSFIDIGGNVGIDWAVYNPPWNVRR